MICKVSDLSENHHSMQAIQKRLQLNLLTQAVQGLPVDVLTHVVDFTHASLPSALLEDIKDYTQHLSETLSLYRHFNRNRKWGCRESDRYHMVIPICTYTCCANNPPNSIAVLSPFAADLLATDLLETLPKSLVKAARDVAPAPWDDTDLVTTRHLVHRPGMFLRRYAQTTADEGSDLLAFEYEMAKIEIRMLLAHMTPLERAIFVAKVRERQELWPPSKLYHQM